MSNKLVNYIKDSIAELKRVEWPTREQTIRHTILVIVISLIVSSFLGIVDFVLTRVLQIVI